MDPQKEGPPLIRPILEVPGPIFIVGLGSMVPEPASGVLARFHTNPSFGAKSGTETGPLRGPSSRSGDNPGIGVPYGAASNAASPRCSAAALRHGAAAPRCAAAQSR
jgi:hypothetical protein